MSGKCVCGQWNLKDDDNFCGYCGKLNMPVSLSESRFRLVSGVTNVLPLTIKNESDKPVKVAFFPKMPGCELVRIKPSGELEVPVKGTSELRLELALESLSDGFARERADFDVVIAENKLMRIPLFGEVLAGPKLRVEPARVRFPVLVHGAQAVQNVTILNVGQLPLTISGLRIDGAAGLSIEPQGSIPAELSPGDALPVKILFEPTSEAESNREPALLRIFAPGLPEEQAVVEAYVRRVGLKAFPEEVLVDPCLSRHRRSVRITLKNTGAEDLSIVGIFCADPWIDVVCRDRIFTLGADVPAGEGGLRSPSQAFFDLFLRAEGLEAGWQSTTISVRTNLDAVHLDISVRIRVVTPGEPHPEYVGIDFGTTASVVSLLDAANMTTRTIEVRDSTGSSSPLIPSVLVMTRNDSEQDRDDFVIGHEAKNLAGARPNETVRSIKRILGYGNDRTILGRKYTPEELASHIIRGLTDLAEYEIYAKETAVRGHMPHYAPVTRAMVTVPANFYDLQIRGILEACRMAGLDTEEEQARAEAKANTGQDGSGSAGIIIDEPSAAAIHFLASLSESGDVMKVIETKGESVFLIYDHGGGTLDVSVVRIQRVGEDLEVRVLANKGNNRVGGDSIDLAVMRELVRRCAERRKDFDQELILNNYNYVEQRATQEMWDAETKAGVFRARYVWKDVAEGVKISLTTENEARFFVDHMSIGRVQGNSYVSDMETFEGRLKMAELEVLVRGLLMECQELVRGAMDLAGVGLEHVDYVVHTGRTSYMPLIQDAIKSVFPALPSKRFVLDSDGLKVCVARGAAFYGAMRAALAKTKIRLVDAGRRLPHAYGVLMYAGFSLSPQFDEIIPIGAECPVSMERHYDTDGPTLQIRFYQNSGKSKHLRNNPEAKPLGQVCVDTRRDGVASGCDVRFVVDANRVLEVYANDSLVPLQPQRLEDDGRWIG
jgi:molecular chaperone DnaK (HSP70)